LIRNTTTITQLSILLEAFCHTDHHGCVGEFEIISDIEDIETIPVGNHIREIERLRKTYGKGFARTHFLDNGEECDAELHWYEAHGIGKKEMKIKNIFD
jgi:hypothetical protein